MSDEKKQLKNYLSAQNEKLNALVLTIRSSFNNTQKDVITEDWLKTLVYKYNFPDSERKTDKQQSFFDVFNEFLDVKKFSDWRKRSYKVVIRLMKRYEIYVQITKDKLFLLTFENITPKILGDFDTFLKNEYLFPAQYPEIYEAVPESRKPEQRGQNTINGIFTKIRTLFIWTVENGKTTNNPFSIFKINECVYGTPYYISIEERNKLYNTDLSRRPGLEAQRDIFVFQCLIGCRVSDLYKLTKQNIIGGAIEYIAGKTKDDRPATVRVPLNSIAKEILAKYAGYKGKTLLPYISEQKYNKAIKEVFAVAGLTRSVTILDSLTRKSVIRPINEIASSHLARRCFIGNLYKQVKDPNLVGVLSGHKEGSRAFARYREIDEDIKTELVRMLE